MNNKNLLAIAAMAVMMIGATVLASAAGSASATNKRHDSIASSLANGCGNGDFPFNPQCQNTDANAIGDGIAQAPVGLQEGGFVIRVINNTTNINNITNVTPPTPPTPESLGCPANTVYDAKLTQALGRFVVGSEVCLQKPGENPDASIVNDTATTATPQSVRVDQSDAGNCSQHEGSATATVNSGTPPDGPPLAIGQTVCITLT